MDNVYSHNALGSENGSGRNPDLLTWAWSHYAPGIEYLERKRGMDQDVARDAFCRLVERLDRDGIKCIGKQETGILFYHLRREALGVLRQQRAQKRGGGIVHQSFEDGQLSELPYAGSDCSPERVARRNEEEETWNRVSKLIREASDLRENVVFDAMLRVEAYRARRLLDAMSRTEKALFEPEGIKCAKERRSKALGNVRKTLRVLEKRFVTIRKKHRKFWSG